MPPTVQARSERAHQAILEAAVRLCAQHGYAGLSIEAIAREAHAGKQTIYRRWPSKGPLLLEAFLASAGERIRFPYTGDIVRDLTTQMLTVAGMMNSATLGPCLWAIMAAARDDPDFGPQFRSTITGPLTEEGVKRIRHAADQGELPADVDAELIIGHTYGALYNRFLVSREPTDEAFVRHNIATLIGLHQLLPTRSRGG